MHYTAPQVKCGCSRMSIRRVPPHSPRPPPLAALCSDRLHSPSCHAFCRASVHTRHMPGGFRTTSLDLALRSATPHSTYSSHACDPVESSPSRNCFFWLTLFGIRCSSFCVDLHTDSPHWISPGNRAWTDSAHISVCNLLPRHPSTPRTNLAFVMEGQPHRTSGACNCSHSSCQQVSIPLLAVDTGTLRVGGHLERIVATSLGRLDVLLSPTSVASWQLPVLFSACFFRTVFALFVSALVRQRYIMMSCEGDI